MVETKLSTNQQYLHGYKVQVEEYAKSEKSNRSIYVLIDFGNPRRIQTIIKEHEKNVRSGKKCPDLVLVDSREKKSASIYKPDDGLIADSFNLSSVKLFDSNSLNFDFPEIEFEGFQSFDDADFGLDESDSKEE